MKKLRIQSDQAMVKLGELLGERVKPGDLLFLSGDLGTGKTTLVKGLAKGMGVEVDITSPTFQLIKTYSGNYPLNHLDLYRLDNEAETDILELEDLVSDGVIVIEWGDSLKDHVFYEYLAISIEFGEGIDDRIVKLVPTGIRYHRMIEELNDVDSWS